MPWIIKIRKKGKITALDRLKIREIAIAVQQARIGNVKGTQTVPACLDEQSLTTVESKSLALMDSGDNGVSSPSHVPPSLASVIRPQVSLLEKDPESLTNCVVPAGSAVKGDNKGMTTNDGMQIAKGLGIDSESEMMLNALNGFIIVLDRKKQILYVSENVEQFLGIHQSKMLGNCIKEFIHPQDVPELKKQYNLKTSSKECPPDLAGDSAWPNLDNKRHFYLRMKYNFQKSGHRAKHTGFTLVHWSGKLKMSNQKPGFIKSQSINCLMCVCNVMQVNSILEIRMDGNMFMSRHELDMRFTFCDARIITLIGYEPVELIGKTAYQFHNPLDAPKIGDCHSNLIVKGTSVSKYYRFLGKNCDWVWMQTRATIIYNMSNTPQYIVCMNYIISEEEGRNYIMMEEEKQGTFTSSAPGVMDLTMCSKPPSVADSHHSDHSDMGYCSANSPMSNHNHSPSSHGNHEEEHALASGTDTDTSDLLHDVAETMNAEQQDDETIFELIQSWKESDMVAMKNGTSLPALLQQSLEQSMMTTSPVVNPCPMAFSPEQDSGKVTNQPNDNSSKKTLDTVPYLISLDPASDMNSTHLESSSFNNFDFAQPEVMGLSDDVLPLPSSSSSSSSSPVTATSLCGPTPPVPSLHSGEAVYSAPSQNPLGPSSGYTSEDSNHSAVSYSSAASSHLPNDFMMSSSFALLDSMTEFRPPVTLMSTASSPDRVSTSSLSLSDDLPTDLSEFCVQFYNSKTARHGKQILEEFRQGEIMSSLEELQKKEAQIMYNGNMPSPSLSEGSYSDGYHSPSHLSTGMGSPPCYPQDQLLSVQLLSGNHKQYMSHSRGSSVSEGLMNKSNQGMANRPKTGARTLNRSASSPACGCKSQQLSKNSSISSRVSSPKSGSVTPRVSPYHMTDSRHSGKCNSKTQQGGMKRQHQRQQFDTRVHPHQHQLHHHLSHHHPQQQQQLQHHHQQILSSSMAQDASQMSELEKLLRNCASIPSASVSKAPASENPVEKPMTPSGPVSDKCRLLEQMLTGQLSGECYHAMEMRRQAQNIVRNTSQ